MDSENQPVEDRIGFLFPDELAEKIGLKEGDVLDVVDMGDGFALRPLDPDLAERMKSADPDGTVYKVLLQNLLK